MNHKSANLISTFGAALAMLPRSGQPIKKLEKPAEITAEPESEPAPAAKPLRDIGAPKGDALSGSALDPKMTFDNFVPGASNEIALGIARQVASAALLKSIPIRERMNFRVQISFTNLFNKANFDVPSLNISAPNAVGTIRAVQTRDLAGPRNGLIGARLDF